MKSPERFIAIDWSGRAEPSDQKKHIWTAVLSAGCAELFAGMTRDELCEWIIKRAKSDATPTVIGFDFAFGFPSGFCKYKRCANADAFWRLASKEGERWLRDCPPPFWGRPCKKRPYTDASDGLRNTDRSISVHGIAPKSPFQIGGAGAVGTGSIRGFPILARLAKAGFSIWPFHPLKFPLVVEIYPRLLTGPVRKSVEAERIQYLQHEEFSEIPIAIRRAAESSEDAFDALVSAVKMRQHSESFRHLRQANDPVERLEGLIWAPLIP